LTPQEEALVSAALAVREQAYAPYSKFPVGAALLTTSGDVFIGCNVENASFGLTQCAERTAVTAAIAAGKRQFAALAIVSAGGAAPCGACRQVLVEFCPDLSILLIDADRPTEGARTSLADLFPARFKLES
jgi:cytidine deaminase